MAFLFNWIRGSPTQPKRIPSDVVIPLHHADSNAMLATIVTDVSLQFDSVLDVDRLVHALKKLVEKLGWRKLGARLRRTVCSYQYNITTIGLNLRQKSGGYEYHVPIEFNEERPAFGFSHTKYDIGFSEHPIASKLPRPNGAVQVTGEPKEYRSLLVSENSPTKIEDWLYTDRAQLTLHFVSFTDTTLLTVTWPHTLMDLMSLHAIFNAWTDILEGRENDVPNIVGEDTDLLAALGDPPDPNPNCDDAIEEEDFILNGKEVTGWQYFRFVYNYLWDLFFTRDLEFRHIILPPSVLSALRSEATSSLTTPSPTIPPPPTIPPSTSSPTTPFISDGDILTAWYIRLLTSCLPSTPHASPTRSIQIINVFNLRTLLTSTSPPLLPHRTAYIGNCWSMIQSFIPLHDLLTAPLGHLAARLRADLLAQTTRAQIIARYRVQRAVEARGGTPPLYGQADMQISPVSNWGKARLFDVDFGTAVLCGRGAGSGSGSGSGERGGRARARGKPVVVLGDATVKGAALRNCGNLTGVDGEGNVWVGGNLERGTWVNVERELGKYGGSGVVER